MRPGALIGALGAALALGCAAAPELIAVSPDPAPAGEVVQLRGAGLGDTASHLTLTPRGGGAALDLDAAEWLDARVLFELPRALPAGRYGVHVEVEGVPSNALELMVIEPLPPVVEAVVPPRADPGGILTVLGSGFGPDGGRVVFSPDRAAETLAWSATEIVVRVPDAADADAVRVETAEGFLSEWFPIDLARLEPTLANLQAAIFTPSCALYGCHGELPAAGLSLVEGEAFANLVGVSSSQLPEVLRVEPFAPLRSLLFDKLAHDAPAVGARMPFGAPPLLPEQLDLVEAWIAGGALE